MTATTFDCSKPMVESGKMTQTIESFNVHMNTIKPSFEQGMYLLKKGLLYIGRHFMGIKNASYSIKAEEDGETVEVTKINFDWINFESVLGVTGLVAGFVLGNVGVAGAVTFPVAWWIGSLVLGAAGVGVGRVMDMLTPQVVSLWGKATSMLKSFWAWLVK